jgi:hypothetical protein
LSKRHAFTARELLDIISENIEKSIKLPNILFHLEKLMSAKMVEVVEEMKEGKTKVRYFGRTAKLFLFGGIDKEFVKKEFFTPISRLIKYYNPEMATSDVDNFFYDYFTVQEAFNNRITKWIEDNHEVINELNIDVLALFEILGRMGSIDNELHEFTKKLGSLLKLK